MIAGVRGWHLYEVRLKIDAGAAWLLKMRVPLTMTLTTAITAPAQIVNGDASMQAIGAAAVQ